MKIFLMNICGIGMMLLLMTIVFGITGCMPAKEDREPIVIEENYTPNVCFKINNMLCADGRISLIKLGPNLGISL